MVQSQKLKVLLYASLYSIDAVMTQLKWDFLMAQISETTAKQQNSIDSIAVNLFFELPGWGHAHDAALRLCLLHHLRFQAATSIGLQAGKPVRDPSKLLTSLD